MLKNTRQTDSTRPNVLLILVDDLGYSDLGCYGGEIRTPHVDSLARDGLLMTQFSNASRCAVSRASLMTGLYQHQAGVGANEDRGAPEYQAALNDQCVTVAEVQREAGYATYLSGKWHLGDEEAQRPKARGFDRSYGILRGMNSYFNGHPVPRKSADSVGLANGLTLDRRRNWTCMLDDVEVSVPETTLEMWARNEGFYTTDVFTDYALEFLDEHHSQRNDQPFFLYLPYTVPHRPIQVFPEDIEKYRGQYQRGWDKLREERYARKLELGVIEPETGLGPRTEKMGSWDTAGENDRQEFIREMEAYAGLVDRIDQNVGRVLARLEDMGVSENTLVIYLSDNAGCHITRQDEGATEITDSPMSLVTYSYISASVSNTPFRLQKQYIHEGGIATPLLIPYSAEITAGLMDRQWAHITDIMPTLVDYCGETYPQTFKRSRIRPLVGQSLRTVFEGRTLKHEKPLYWEYRGNEGVRVDDWKLVAAHPGLEWELYNMADDRSEPNDLAASVPHKRDELIALYTTWATENHVLPPEPGRIP